MKKIITALLLLAAITIEATEVEYKLNENQKIEGTFSADLNKEQSIHLIFTKNSKSNLYEITPFYMDSEENTSMFNVIETKKRSSIISYHIQNNTLSLLLSHKFKKIEEYIIVDFDLNTKKQTIKKIKKGESNTVFRLKNKTIIINKLKTSWDIIEINSTKTISKSNIKINAENQKDFETIFESSPDIVNTNEYVKNGSIQKNQAFYNDNKIIFTNTSNSSFNTKIITIDLVTKNYSFIKYLNSEIEKIKDINTYIYNNTIFSIIVNKTDAILKINKLNKVENLYRASLNNELANYLDSEIVKSLIKKASKKINKPTITVNKSIEHKLVLNIDYVDTNTYSYNYDWWLHHWMFTQQVHMQQTMHHIKVNLPSFGPNPMLYNDLAFYTTKTEKKSIKLVMNTDFSINKNASKETINKEIDRDNYLDKLKKNKDLKHITASFQEKSFRYIYYSKPLKKFQIKTSKL